MEAMVAGALSFLLWVVVLIVVIALILWLIRRA